MSVPLRGSILWIAAAILAGCAVDSKLSKLDTASNAYGTAIRWGEYEHARQFQGPEAPPADPNRYQGLRVTGYDILRQEFLDPASKNRVRLTALIRYYDEEYGVEKSYQDVQEWRFDPAKESWQIVTGLPAL